MMRIRLELSEKEQEQAAKWRIEKCGYDSFGVLFGKFGEIYGGKNAK